MEAVFCDVHIRPAKREDMASVCCYIKALAEFHQKENEVTITTASLIKDGFETTPPRFSCFVAETSRHQIVGYALYYTCYSTWLGKYITLEDIYVDSEYRKYGVGKQLFLSVAKVANEYSSGRLDFHVLSSNPAVHFYNKLGAKNLTKTDAWQLFRLDKQSLKQLVEKHM